MLSSIGDPDLRATLLVVSSLEEPATSQAGAAAMVVHPTVARSRRALTLTRVTEGCADDGARTVLLHTTPSR